jgi:hypothetical protein
MRQDKISCISIIECQFSERDDAIASKQEIISENTYV